MLRKQCVQSRLQTLFSSIPILGIYDYCHSLMKGQFGRLLWVVFRARFLLFLICSTRDSTMRQGRIANAMSRTVVNGLLVRLARLAAQVGSIQQPQLRPQACIDDFASCKRSYDQRCQLRDHTLCKTLSDCMPKQTASSRIANWISTSMFRGARMRRSRRSFWLLCPPRREARERHRSPDQL